MCGEWHRKERHFSNSTVGASTSRFIRIANDIIFAAVASFVFLASVGKIRLWYELKRFKLSTDLIVVLVLDKRAGCPLRKRFPIARF